jgi:hypothetical protein
MDHPDLGRSNRAYGTSYYIHRTQQSTGLGNIWTGEKDAEKVFPCEDQGDRGITVAVASGVVTWLHYGRSPPRI